MSTKTLPVVSSAFFLAVSALAFMTIEQRYVAAPGIAAFIMVLWLWMTLWDRDKQVPIFDIGAICALATLAYTAYPLVNYWADGFSFGYLSDLRLQSYNIAPDELGLFHLRHLLYLAAFVSFYSLFRGRASMETANVEPASRATRQVILLFFVLLTVYFFLLQLATGINFNASYATDARAGYMEAFASVPRLVSQISVKLAGIMFVFKLALLATVVNRCREQKWLAILILWIGVEFIQVVLVKGGRSSLVFFLIAAALLYHRTVKPLSLKFALISGTALFSVFIFLGLYRSYDDVSALRADLSQTRAGIFSGHNEFQALLGTAYDVLARKEAGAYLPWYLYINDFIAILPPQQLLPFEKVAASEWYLREIGVSGTGQGYMWGVVSQSIIGLDWLELALRGAVLGYILARLHRWYIKNQSGFLETLLYVFLCVKVYYTFRDTTFSLLANLVWEIIPFYMILRISGGLPARKVRKVRKEAGHERALSAGKLG